MGEACENHADVLGRPVNVGELAHWPLPREFQDDCRCSMQDGTSRGDTQRSRARGGGCQSSAPALPSKRRGQVTGTRRQAPGRADREHQRGAEGGVLRHSGEFCAVGYLAGEGIGRRLARHGAKKWQFFGAPRTPNARAQRALGVPQAPLSGAQRRRTPKTRAQRARRRRRPYGGAHWALPPFSPTH